MKSGSKTPKQPLAVTAYETIIKGARRSALMFSLIGTCKLHDVEPYEYLNDVINRIGEYPKENLHHLLPDLWKVHFKK